MSTDKTTVQAAAPNALQDFTDCPQWGQGGQFMYDPETQKRTRIVPVEEQPAATEGAVEVASVKKGNTRANS